MNYYRRDNMRQKTIYSIALAILSTIFLSPNIYADTVTDEQTEQSKSFEISFEKYNNIELTGITIIEHPKDHSITLDKDKTGANILFIKHTTDEKMTILWESKKDNIQNHLNFKVNNNNQNTEETNRIKIKNTILEKSDKKTTRQTLNYREAQQILNTLKKHKENHDHDPESILKSLKEIRNIKPQSTCLDKQKTEANIAQEQIPQVETITTKQYTSETTYYSTISQTTQTYTTSSATCPRPDLNDDCYISYPEVVHYFNLWEEEEITEECFWDALYVSTDASNPDTSENGCLNDNELISYILLWQDNIFCDNCLIQAIHIWMGDCEICTIYPFGSVSYNGNYIDISPRGQIFTIYNEYNPSTPHDKVIYHSFKWYPMDLWMLQGRSDVYPFPDYFTQEFVLNVKSNNDIYDFCQPPGSPKRTYEYVTKLPEPHNDRGSEESAYGTPCYFPFTSNDEEIEIATLADSLYPLNTHWGEGDGYYFVAINVKSNNYEGATIHSTSEIGNHIEDWGYGSPCIHESLASFQYNY